MCSRAFFVFGLSYGFGVGFWWTGGTIKIFSNLFMSETPEVIEYCQTQSQAGNNITRKVDTVKPGIYYCSTFNGRTEYRHKPEVLKYQFLAIIFPILCAGVLGNCKDRVFIQTSLYFIIYRAIFSKTERFFLDICFIILSITKDINMVHHILCFTQF